MGQIKLLEEHIADKIAAGEVIERPLSVVKELLENSLDAEADFIEIEIREGGTSLIRVKDNGKGMDEADLQLAFQRHATSKIREFQDLFRLQTFGFRGEALPSIAAVAQVEMISCTAQETIGHKIRIDGGTVQEFCETATAPGTVMEVKNLFYNIPARRKFLKSSSYEAGLIGDLISKYAMGHPASAVSLCFRRSVAVGYGRIDYCRATNCLCLRQQLRIAACCGRKKKIRTWSLSGSLVGS